MYKKNPSMDPEHMTGYKNVTVLGEQMYWINSK